MDEQVVNGYIMDNHSRLLWPVPSSTPGPPIKRVIKLSWSTNQNKGLVTTDQSQVKKKGNRQLELSHLPPSCLDLLASISACLNAILWRKRFMSDFMWTEPNQSELIDKPMHVLCATLLSQAPDPNSGRLKNQEKIS